MRHRVRARLLLTFVCTAWALAVPASALAAGGSPVHVDPSSPVAKEYALPLSTARGAPPESGKPGKLFGSGITHPSSTAQTTTPTETVPAPPQTQPQITTAPTQVTTTPTAAVTTTPTAAVTTTPTAAVTTTPTAAATTHAHRHPPHVTTVTLPTLTAPAAAKQLTAKATPAAYRVLRPGTGSGLLWMVVAAVAVLAIGSAGGLLLSRRR